MFVLKGIFLALAVSSAFGFEEEIVKGRNDLICDEFMPNFRTKSDKDCYHYFSCHDGKLKEKKCPLKQKFDPVKAKCQLWPQKEVNCSADPAPLPEPWPRFDCIGRSDFKTNSPWACHHFIECKSGQMSTGECPLTNRWFQPSTQECRPTIEHYVCEKKPHPLPDKTTTVMPTSIHI